MYEQMKFVGKQPAFERINLSQDQVIYLHDPNSPRSSDYNSELENAGNSKFEVEKSESGINDILIETPDNTILSIKKKSQSLHKDEETMKMVS
ncbi:hypothetical protein AYI69_g6980 [Smittium culicis]|uniref:Uncharacterized protein n=1 Tax=Smittium culicis TaxID=133412 RepID=A0A1R1XV84_9FUNG|nr:hypothetical protein AYI69_g6980 [Smittium culicis]